MKFIAVDPGSNNMGLAFFDTKKKKKLRKYAVVIAEKNIGPARKIQYMVDRVMHWCIEYEIDTIVLEKPFQGGYNTASLYMVGLEIRFHAKKVGIKLEEFTSSTIKVHHGIRKQKKKGNKVTQKMVKDRMRKVVLDAYSNVSKVTKQDTIDAIFLGDYFLWLRKNRSGK